MSSTALVAKDIKAEEFQALVPANAKLALEMNWIKLQVEKNPNVPKDQFVDFLYKAQLTGADPRLGQVHLIAYNKKYKEGNDWKTRVEASTVFNYLFLIQKAEETGQLDGFESGIKNIEAPMKDWIAWARVYRKDWKHPVYVECHFVEFAKIDKEKNLIAQWASMPAYMLEKCALANAIRRAFPNLSGIYIDEEMVQGETISKMKDVTPPSEPKPPKKETKQPAAKKEPPSEKKEPPKEQTKKPANIAAAKRAIADAGNLDDLKKVLERIEKSPFDEKQLEELKECYFKRTTELEPEPPQFSEEDDFPDFNGEQGS